MIGVVCAIVAALEVVEVSQDHAPIALELLALRTASDLLPGFQTGQQRRHQRGFKTFYLSPTNPAQLIHQIPHSPSPIFLVSERLDRVSRRSPERGQLRFLHRGARSGIGLGSSPCDHRAGRRASRPREAADLSLTHGLAMADSLVYATARRFGATLVTGDADFEGWPTRSSSADPRRTPHGEQSKRGALQRSFRARDTRQGSYMR